MARAVKRLFRRIPLRSTSGEVGLVLHQAPIQDFQGDYVVTSTNRALEGIHRKNWWGFAGRSSCDASLHKVYQLSKSYPNYLVTESRNEMKKKSLDQKKLKQRCEESTKTNILPFSSCVITEAGPLLPKIRRIAHTCIPRYPRTAEQGEPHLHTTLPHAWVSSKQDALDLLKKCYDDVFTSILNQEKGEDANDSEVWKWIPTIFSDSDVSDYKELAICLPAIGCGYNGYPIEEAANIALDCIYRINDETDTAKKRMILVEIRFKEMKTFHIWEKEVLRRSPLQFQPST